MADDVKMEEADDNLSSNIGTSILMQFTDSTREDHLELRRVVVVMSYGFKEENVPPTADAYLRASCSALLQLQLRRSNVATIEAHLKLLSLVIPKFSPEKLTDSDNIDLVSRSLHRALWWNRSLPESAGISGIKCASHMLITSANKCTWSRPVSRLFQCLMFMAIGITFKVRQELWWSLCDVLRSFQGTELIAPASAAIGRLFRQWFPCGTPVVVGSEGRTVADQGMYALDVLTECLYLIYTKYKIYILTDFKIILKLQTPVVTRRVVECLHKLCFKQSLDVPPQLLLDLLCILSHSVYKNNGDEHNAKLTARLLNIGMAKVYSSNKQICVMRLPIVFNALKGIMGQKEDSAQSVEEHHEAAAYSFKCLIHACIDKSLIKQGKEQIAIKASIDASKSYQPSIIEHICYIIESLLGDHYSPIWNLSFEIVSTMLDKLGAYSAFFMKGIVKRLADMQKLSEKEFYFRKQMHECLGSALIAMGHENFLGLLPLNLEAEDPSGVNDWLFPILANHTIGARLSFFTNSILVKIKMMKEKSQKLRLQGVSSRSTDELVYSLWSLLPSFCNYPTDTVESFGDLKEALCTSLFHEPQFRTLICSSLYILIRQNKRTTEEADDLSKKDMCTAEQRCMANYTLKVKEDNLSVIEQSASQFISVLSDVFLDTTDSESNLLQSILSEFASISNIEVVSMRFKHTMEKLLTAQGSKAESSRDSNSMRAHLFELAVSLLPGLTAGEVDYLFNAIKLALQDNEVLIQKKGYKILSVILQDFDGFLSWKLEELHTLMTEMLPSCHSSAKQERLECLCLLVVHVLMGDTEQRLPDITRSFLAEIILALKGGNKRTRKRAFDILVQIGRGGYFEETSRKTKHLCRFFTMVAEGLTCGNLPMISATIEGLARLAYEFSDAVSAASNLLTSTFLRLPTQSEEIIKANLGYFKVLVAKLPTEVLQLHMKSMVEGLLNCQFYAKTSLKAKVKLLLEMLFMKCGIDDISDVMPGNQMELLANLQKIMEEEKILGSKFVKARLHVSKASTFRLSRWDYTEIFSDYDEETGDSNADYMDTEEVLGRSGKGYLQLKSITSLLRSKKRKNRSSEDLSDQTEDKSHKRIQYRPRKGSYDHTLERDQIVVEPKVTDDPLTKYLATQATWKAMSGAAEVTKKLTIEV